jgi:hypothetical protein
MFFAMPPPPTSQDVGKKWCCQMFCAAFNSQNDKTGQQLGQHWFITAYIAVYIQGLYTVNNGARVQSTVAMLGLTTNQGCWQPQQGSPLSTGSGEERTGQRLILVTAFRWRCRYRLCEGCEGAASPRRNGSWLDSWLLLLRW